MSTLCEPLSLKHMTKALVSFAVACFDSATFLEAAVASALGQRGVEVEVILVDDGSSDGSDKIAARLAREDHRVRFFQTPSNLGPGGARNIALREARGDWIAVLDSDDLIHPDRSARLIAEAEASGADLIADDLIVFDDARCDPPSLFLPPGAGPTWIDLPHYLRSTAMFARGANLGFLKPVIRRPFLVAHDIRYDERLRIAEDDDLVIQLLVAGARYRLLPAPLYFYRKHGTSISHRLSTANTDRMLAAADRLQSQLSNAETPVRQALTRRHRAMRDAWAFVHIVDALKLSRFGHALRLGLSRPGALALMRMPIAGALGKLRRRSIVEPSRHDATRVLFISRQRLIGATNGSSTYLIALAEATRAAGYEPHLLQPSPAIFGRTPFFRLRPEMKVFASIALRRSIRIGDCWFALDWRVYRAAALGTAARLLRRIGIDGPLTRERKAPYSIAAPWQRDDLLFVADHTRARPAVAIADYIFQTEALLYLLDSSVRTATVMHDRFSARAGQFGEALDSVAVVSEDTEIALLGTADAVIAIQAEEAAFVRTHAPRVTTILAPMAQATIDAAQPGDDDRLLFVGSNTAPNVHGLRWFLEDVWPVIRERRPTVVLEVAGTVAAAFDRAPEGVRFLGMVGDLAGLYARAGVVISPLIQGSGLKIKLIEALAHGKACVVTGVTLQGVEEELTAVVRRADHAADFASAIIGLLGDRVARELLCQAGLVAARQHFSPGAAYRDFRAWLAAGKR